LGENRSGIEKGQLFQIFREEEMSINRRQFLKSGAMVGAAAALSGTLSACQPAQASNLPSKWDAETEVLVIGYGLAGAATALAAKEAGAKVIVLEKNDEEHEGGNSKLSANLVFIPGNAKDGLAYFKGMNEGHMHDITEDMMNTWINGMLENRDWITKNLDAKLTAVPATMGMGPELPHLPGAENMQIYMVNGTMYNAALWNPVTKLVKANKIEIRYKTAANKLYADEKGRVIGARAVSDGKEINIKAKKAVVLTTGGFEFNESMKANYLRGPIYGMGNMSNTGDGVHMAQALGADLWHMNNPMGPIAMGFVSPDLKDDAPEAMRIVGASTTSYFWTDKYGKRFVNETRAHDHGRGFDIFYYYDGNKGEFPNNPCWLVFDQTGISAGPVGVMNNSKTTTKIGWAGWYTKYQWSLDNSEELKKGWIIKADTIEELAQKTKMDPAVLAASLKRFNDLAKTGKDDDFGRAKITELKGPFYAISQVPGMVNTQGGPKRNHKGQVLHVEGNPIPRLYSSGELGSIYAWQYQGGGNLGECLYMGRIAGKNAAAETSI
jgi:3-oxosteroid 1-dehydrogenase